MKDGLYHVDVGLPKLTFGAVLGLVPSQHALFRAAELRIPEVPRMFSPASSKVIEVEIRAGKVVKLLARKTLDETRDLCYVFLTETKLVKTVWINQKSDTHTTLDRTRFVRP